MYFAKVTGVHQMAHLHRDGVNLHILWDTATCASVLGILAAIRVRLVGGTLRQLFVALQDNNLQDKCDGFRKDSEISTRHHDMNHAACLDSRTCTKQLHVVVAPQAGSPHQSAALQPQRQTCRQHCRL